MPNSDRQQKIFVVVESGAQWPARLDFGGLTDVHIVAQQALEPKLDFARRVSARLSRACRAGSKVAASVFLVSRGLNCSDVEARCAIARSLASALAWKPGAELTLTGHALSRECHAHLVAMALVIEDEINDAVRIRISAEPERLAHTERAIPRSGIFARIDAEPRLDLRKAN